ncbi:hypothetical protein B9N43_11670 [Denitratisoma sp. DHT3]|uniref:MarR family winged helix-turn-helix transcriptional regulator n=1 Tax=Denitratisoma sp. DHT3 TaxID=1981880 RepID=UPI001198940B|nr:MarR family winged helix-turn-helix transcriptional regulator [Denitratisoma sp. DHT3]QDX81851.1 hypothetical protein B9N43_11670 [Denitratisoma sp. DHT3]
MSVKKNPTVPPAGMDIESYQTQHKMPLGFLMGMVNNALIHRVDMALAPWSITGSQWGVCRMIQKGLGSTAADLCRIYGYDSGAIARILQALEKKGLIRRERSPDDQRRMDIKVTDQGHALIAESLPSVRRVGTRTIKGFTEEEVSLFKDFVLRAYVQLIGEDADEEE